MYARTLSPLLASALVALAVVPTSASAGRRGSSSPATKPVTAPVTAPVAAAAAPVADAVPAPVVATPAVAAATAAAAEEVTAEAVSEMTEVCADTPTFKAFKAFGDTADYAFAPGGSFESGAPGWTLNGASVVNTNENIGVFAGTKALKINDNTRVTSPWFCVTPANPHFRFVTYGGEVEMEIEYKVIGESDIDDDLVGETHIRGSWTPSNKHELATEIPASKLAKGVLARIIFKAQDDIYVDNVLVDPYRRG